jgi:transcriptional regulator with XRE-family HTH domain
MNYEREPPDPDTVAGRIRLIRLEYAKLGTNRAGRPLSQARFAELVPLSRERLASYEAGLVPLNFQIGWAICRIANRSQLWLATGQGPSTPFLAVDFGEARSKLTDRTLFLKGITVIWDSLMRAAVTRGISVTELPSAKPDLSLERPAQAPKPAANPKGTIRVTDQDRAAGRLGVTPEFMHGCAPANAPALILLTHPGVASVLGFITRTKRPKGAALSLLRDALPAELREEDFLRRLEPLFLLELEMAVQKLVGALPSDN